MSSLWYLSRARKENHAIHRMMRQLPIDCTRARDVAPPFPPLRLTPFCNSPAAQETRFTRAMDTKATVVHQSTEYEGKSWTLDVPHQVRMRYHTAAGGG